MSETTARPLAVITGASRGLGRALAVKLATEGYTIAACATNADRLAQLSEELGPEHLLSTVDVTDAEAVSVWAQGIIERFGPPDLLLNNAALINQNAKLWEVPLAEFHRLMDVNINGVFHVIRAFAPAMAERRSGVIVNFSSTWGRSTSPDVAPYCASKFAIEGLSQAMSQETPAGMAVVALNPGVIHTDMLEICFGSGAAAYPSPQEWAERAAALLMSLGPRHNGQSLTVS